MSHTPIGFAAPAAGFDDPLVLWLACHRRVNALRQWLTAADSRAVGAAMDARRGGRWTSGPSR